MKESKAISSALQEFYRKPSAVITIELLLTLGLTIFLAISFIKPTLSTMSQLSKEIKEKKELSQKLEKKAVSLATAQTVYFAAQDKLQSLNQAIPNQDTLMRDVKTIEKLATDNAVVISSLSINSIPQLATTGAQIATSQPSSSPDVSEQQSRLPLALTIEGDYLSIRDFVDDIISNRRLYLIEKVSFSIKKQERNQSLAASLIIETPYNQ